jgi:ABC-type branched-subunit amino acid transport system substrate-binding protein
VSRKSVLPVFEELNGLLYYPVQYEGEESSNNVFYPGAASNQQAIAAVEYLMSEGGGAVKRWVLEGTALANAGVKADNIPVVAFSVGEEELAAIDTKNLVGHLAAWNYFESVQNSTNDAFIKQGHEFIKNPKRVTNDPMEAHYIGFKM